MRLAGAHYELFVDLRPGLEGNVVSAANHVRAGIRIPREPRGEHVGNYPAQILPRVELLLKPQDYGLPRHSRIGAKFVIGEVQRELRPFAGVVRRNLAGLVEFEVAYHEFGVARVEFEAVHAVLLLHAAQDLFQRVRRLGVGEVVCGAVPAPPVENGGRIARIAHCEQPLLFEVAEFGGVGGDERRDPQNRLEAH